MPELPEVETVCAGLRSLIKGTTIEAVKCNAKGLRAPFPKNLSQIEGRTVSSITRRAKYILINLQGGLTLIVHLGMSGQFIVSKNYVARKHDHLLINFSNGKIGVLNDPRRFGLVDLAETEKLLQHKVFKQLGPEPLEDEFNAEYLERLFARRKVAVKLAIMDQKIVVGVGNIYACESLFDSKINPERASDSLSKKELTALVDSIKMILKKAIEAGGSSLRDYAHADGSLGSFQTMCKTYGREGDKCVRAKCNGKIERITQGGRSTFFCPICQK